MSLKKSYKKIIDNTLKLKGNYQLPSYLALKIIQINEESKEEYVKLLSNLSLHYMRVKGYYKQFPYMEKKANMEIKDLLERRND